jgi:hypothetical protein
MMRGWVTTRRPGRWPGGSVEPATRVGDGGWHPGTPAERLHALAELYQQGQVSDLMDRTLEKLLRHEAEQCQAQLSQLQADDEHLYGVG